MAGVGRGGRGAFLLQALQQPIRRPGQPPAGQLPTEQPQQQQQQQCDAEQQVQPPGPGPAPGPTPSPVSTPTQPMMGRGFVSPQLRPPPAIGRGFASPLTSPQPPSAAQTPPPMARGRALQQPVETIRKPQRLPGSESPPSPARPRTEHGNGFPSPTQPHAGLRNGFPSPSQPRAVHGSGLPPSPSPSQPPTQAMGQMGLDAGSKKGSSGQRVPLSANYIRLRVRNEGVFQYNVTFQPSIESKNMRFALLNEHKDLIGNTRAFDGTILFLPRKITDSSVARTGTRKTDGATITITITLTNMVHYAGCIQLFNVIFRRVLRALDLKQVGRSYFNPSLPISIPQHKLELWPGYVSSIAEYDGGLLLLFDVSHKLLRTDSALDFLYELYSQNKHRFQEMAVKHLVGCVVLTRYNNRTYRIDDIAWDKNPSSTFIDHSGSPISFVEYYRKAYGREINDVEQPLLIHRAKRKAVDGQQDAEPVEEVICLVPELCSMTGLTDMARSDFRVMKDIAAHTRIDPNKRESSIRSFLQQVMKTPKAAEELSSWGLELDTKTIQLQGRRLAPQKILFNRKTVVASDEADWSRDAVKECCISAVPLENWAVFVTQRDKGKAMDFISMLKKVAPPMGIEVTDAVVCELHNDRTDTYLQAIRQAVTPKMQLVVMIFPTSRDDRYSAVKKLCCIDSPIPSQVINSRTISQQQKLRSVTQKIALQMNCKLGGELWALEIPLKSVMVIGMDVYHDGSQGKKRAIAGFVASTNQSLTRWYSRVAIQGMKQEIMDGLKLCMQASLKKYHEVNSALPEKIIVFRDGVGDGQIPTVTNFEIPQLSTCFDMFGESYKPKMAVVIVQKRIATRIFSQTSRGLGNPGPGTVVDHTISRKSNYDFFLVSQHVRQGTVSPTHYNVVFDETGLKPDHMQRLTYKMTHMYYNWPGTIRVPAPCQYAHKLAFLVGQSLHRVPAVELSDRLFFL